LQAFFVPEYRGGVSEHSKESGYWKIPPSGHRFLMNGVIHFLV
jgi:hypothetical protein